MGSITSAPLRLLAAPMGSITSAPLRLLALCASSLALPSARRHHFSEGTSI